ncbi:MAG: TonB-dependent receptor, partial [Acidobacteriota bacterium]
MTLARIRRHAIAGLLLIGLLLTPAAWADDAPASDDDGAVTETETNDDVEPQGTYLDAVTVAATRSERTLGDTPGKIDRVERETIEERGYTSIEDIARYLPGVDVEGDPTRLGANGFTIRGVGGNRVLTEIDGVPTAEQFDFGPFAVHQFALDVDALASVEVVRSAGSALYGSDALGGVVALTTRDPRSYLQGGNRAINLRGGYDGRQDEASASGTVAFGGDRVQGALLYTRRDGSELDNQGDIDARDFTRTAPNPIDRTQNNVVAQLSFTPSDRSTWRGIAEWYDTETETDVLSAINPGSPFASATLDSFGIDEQTRTRISVEHTLTRSTGLFDTLLWRAYAQETDTEQRTLEQRLPSQGLAQRDGLLTFDQETYGLRAELRKALGSSVLLTYGASYQADAFEQLRDRTETLVDTGAPLPSFLAFPTRYFPGTDVEELGAFVQAEINLFDDRLTLIPGVRFDRYTLDADQNDAIFLSGNPGTPAPVDLDEDAVSPKLGAVLAVSDRVSLFAQYASGFRAPPMSEVNNGFTNLGGGYRTLPNPDLEPETSDNVELGVRFGFERASLSVTAYQNQYEDFIEIATLGFDPITFLIEFQAQNVSNVEIEGVEV